MAPPFGTLAYLYVGTRDFEADLRYYRDTLGAEAVWDLRGFGARVAAFRVSTTGPLLLVADHRDAPSCHGKSLRARGWRPHGDRFEVPDGPCFLFHDASGNELAVMGNERPRALEGGV